MTQPDEKQAFSLRLKQALKRSAKKIDTPTELALQFNLRHQNDSITVQAAQKWMTGKARPAVDKIETLAAMLIFRRNGYAMALLKKDPPSQQGAKHSHVIHRLQRFNQLTMKSNCLAVSAFCRSIAGIWCMKLLSSSPWSRRCGGSKAGYLLLATACDGTLATTAQFTSIRVVCNNTLAISLANGSGAVKVPHSTRFDPPAVKKQLGISISAWDSIPVPDENPVRTQSEIARSDELLPACIHRSRHDCNRPFQ